MDGISYSQWLFYEMKYIYRTHIKGRFIDNNTDCKTTKYASKRVLSLDETNKKIYEYIMSGCPFWVGRLGGNEMNTIAYFNRYKLFPFRTDARKECVHDLYLGAGFFPEELDAGNKFVCMMMEITKNIDLIGAWNLYMEEWFLKVYAHDVNITNLTDLQPWLADKKCNAYIPWTAALAGKKVLVIHPFAESIEMQYTYKREKIFDNFAYGDKLLPEFELKTLKAIQSIGNSKVDYANWFEALSFMIDECKKIEFDVAIIGCGAYGYPLADAIKKMGKGAIHLGGITQLLFGIRGNRWDRSKYQVYADMVNDAWIRPSEKEQITDAHKIEGACYW